jgi:hypothetical protein
VPEARAEAVFVWLTPFDAPGLATRIDAFTFAGELWPTIAVGSAAAALAVASLPWLTLPSLPGLDTRTDRFTFDGVLWSAVPAAWEAGGSLDAPFPPASAAAEASFDWPTELFAPGCPTRADALVFEAPF